MLLTFIARDSYKSDKVSIQLYKALVKLHLQFCVDFWSLYLKDIFALKAVQRQFTNLIPGMKELIYREVSRLPLCCTASAILKSEAKLNKKKI